MNTIEAHAVKTEILKATGRSWRKFGTYKTPRSAGTIASMIRWSSNGLRVMRDYPANTFDAKVRGTEVWVRRYDRTV